MNEERTSPLVLVVEANPDALMALSDILKGHYRTKVTTSGERALAIVGADPIPDVILLAAAMDGMDGYELCAKLKSEERTRHIPVVFIASEGRPFDERRAFASGATDYIARPFSPTLVLNRVRTMLALKRANDRLLEHNVELDGEVARQLQEIQRLQDGIVIALATLAESRDDETANHLRRVQHYVRATALRLRETNERYAADLSARQIEAMFRAVPLHDIGKIGVPDRVLLQPGPYSKEEFELSMRHTTIGSEALALAGRTLSYPNLFLTVACEIAQNHHERWDGAGYPRGLRGDQIPLSARLMAVADTYDALVTRRFYKNPVGHEDAIEAIREGRGTQFDPDVVDAFLAEAATMQRIAQKYADNEVDLADKLLQMEREFAKHVS